jgi:hypothetical protein
VNQPQTLVEIGGDVKLTAGILRMRLLDESGAVVNDRDATKTQFSAAQIEGANLISVKLNPGSYSGQVTYDLTLGKGFPGCCHTLLSSFL